MRKYTDNPEIWRARQARVARGKAIRSGALPGLFESDGKKLKADVRAMIDAAIARRADAGRPLAADAGDVDDRLATSRRDRLRRGAPDVH